jgi:tetratricopeptide (TPR) repeat protein
MIMPYGRKATQVEPGRGPAEIDFNALWDRGYVPVIKALGYDPVRADQDTGALIISQMLERLYFADLVLADMTIANSNVYYEVGIRHAAKVDGCVLLAADWSQQLFDVAQMRTIRYPLPEGDITAATAEVFKAKINDAILPRASGTSPMYESIRGYPNHVDPEAASSMKEQMAALAAFQTKVRAVRAAPREKRMHLTLQLVASDGSPPPTYPVTLALLLLLRDSVETDRDWTSVHNFLRSLPANFARQPEALEHLALAISKSGNKAEAIAVLETLIAARGPTPERLGLLGGRYKSLATSPTSGRDRLEYLAKAIECYERGMDLDLNDYYCSCNLPRLYRQRRDPGDEERAQAVLKLVIAACERAKRRNLTDEWLRSTLLGAAFDAGDADKAEELAREVAREGSAGWKLDATLKGLEASLTHVADPTCLARLQKVIADLRAADL